MNEKAQKSIIDMIEMQYKQYPCLHFKYVYDASESTHIVDVDGKDTEFLDNDEWQEIIYDLVSQFESEFENEYLLFVSPGSLVRINDKNLLYEIKAKTKSSKKTKGPSSTSWLTSEAIRVDEEGYIYNPHADTPKGRVRKKSNSSFDFSLHIESVLTNVRTGFFINR